MKEGTEYPSEQRGNFYSGLAYLLSRRFLCEGIFLGSLEQNGISGQEKSS